MRHAQRIRLIVTSLDANDLTKENGTTNDFLTQEYTWLRGQLSDNKRLSKSVGANKASMIENVLKARKLLLAKDANALETRANGLVGNLPNANAPSDLDTEMFYKLTETARSAFRDKRPLSRSDVPEEVNTDSQQSAGSLSIASSVPFHSQGIMSTQSSRGSRQLPESPESETSKRVRFEEDEDDDDSTMKM